MQTRKPEQTYYDMMDDAWINIPGDDKTPFEPVMYLEMFIID